MAEETQNNKNKLVENELETLKFWQENRIFEKSLAKPSPKGEFIFYEGPPTANGKPGIHHLEARAFKDAIPRYKTMQGFHVRRKGGWDTHGLPVELAVEKELGLKSKKEIETYGIEKFNKKCRESVWKYVKEWTEFTDRIGYWVDLKRPYITYKPYYIEAVWNIISKINERGLLYKDYKVVPWCPRCGTALSSHELAQGYQDDKDLAVTVKFEIRSTKSETNSKLQIPNGEKTYLLAWTTTPWTLPGNVGLAINPKTAYCKVASLKLKVKSGEEISGIYIVAKERLATVLKDYEYEVVEELKGEKLVGLEYEPLYPFLSDNISESEKPKLQHAYKVYGADFVTTTDGTGIVHTAVMYGADDFELGTKVGLPKHHLVNDDGTFKKETGFLAGKFVKDPETDVSIIKDLANRTDGSLLFAKEKYAHSYPHCWRCKTPLIYFARDSWYIKMSALRDELLAENQKINWEPSYIKDGRFGEWLKDVKDWAISRERYWGTPLPVWECSGCGKKKIIGSFDELFLRGKNKKLTRLILVRHGESEKNILGLFDSSRDKYPLTKLGEERAKKAGEEIKKMSLNRPLGSVGRTSSQGEDVLGGMTIYASPVLRTRQTAEIIGKGIGVEPVLSDALWEARSGEWDGKEDSVTAVQADRIAYNKLPHDIFYKTPRGKTGESWQEVEDRVVGFAREILTKHAGETVVIVSHEGPLMTLLRYLKELSIDEITNLWEEDRIFHPGILGSFAEPTPVHVDIATGKEIDPHRPFIDEISLACDCAHSTSSGQGEMKRVKEVMDVWFDSGAMPFAQDADRCGQNADKCGKESGRDSLETVAYPADFISEAIDQTRGWFYTLHAIGTLLGKGNAFKNVICLGHILDAEGKKMSKSVGNVVDPNLMMEKYGADPLRFWMYSVNQPGEPKNFDEKTVDEMVKKVLNRLDNVLQFYKLYAGADSEFSIFNPLSRGQVFQFSKKLGVLDAWIITRLNQLTEEVTKRLDEYKLLEPTRAIRDFIDDLSVWYLRRSRDRFKGNDEADKQSALQTTHYTLLTLSKLMAPFTPFFAEYLYKAVGGEKESVHLEDWPAVESRIKNQPARTYQSPLGTGGDSGILEEMQEVRKIVSFGLEARAKSGIKVRQPLSSLRVKNHESRIMNHESLLQLIADEVNVKNVLFDEKIQNDVELDIVITPELKEEGNVRELVRAIQELRKGTGLNSGDFAILTVDADGVGKKFVEKYEDAIKKSTQLKEISFSPLNSGAEISLDNFSLKISVTP